MLQRILDIIRIGGKISIDSRNINAGDVFFAIGRGHDFICDAIEKGASLIVASDPKGPHDPKLLLVDDTLKTLLQIGDYVKRSSKAKIIGITGSVGKTTTKAWLSQVLSKTFNVLPGIKNYNTIYGVPICLSQLTPNHDIGVFEMGSNNVGEISELSRYLEPDVAIITNIMESHIGQFGNKEILAYEKISVIDGLKVDGILVFNGDSEFRDIIIQKAEARNIRTISYGYAQHNDFVVNDYVLYFQSDILHHNFIKTCILAAIYALDLEISSYFNELAKLEPLAGRGRIQKYKYSGKSFWVIDDSYNASLSTMLSSIDTLDNMRGYHKKIAVLGEMKELGEFQKEYHQKLVSKLLGSHINNVIFVGSPEVSCLFQNSNMCVFDQLDEICLEKILSLIENDDIILLKGSRSIGLDKILDVLQPTI